MLRTRPEAWPDKALTDAAEVAGAERASSAFLALTILNLACERVANFCCNDANCVGRVTITIF